MAGMSGDNKRVAMVEKLKRPGADFPVTTVFETMRAYKGNIFRLNEHLRRLRASAVSAGLQEPDIRKTGEKLKRELARSGLGNACLRAAYDGRNLPIIVKPLPVFPQRHYKEGVKIITVPTIRNIPSAVDGKIKCGNFLWGVMAKIEASGTFEGILLNKDGYVTEGTISNIFIITYHSPGISPPSKIEILTPPGYLGVLEGITRKAVIEIARELNLPANEKPFTRLNLYSADECFLTNTSIEVTPVVNIDGRAIGGGTPGRITMKLWKAFKRFAVQGSGMPRKRKEGI